MMGCTSATQSAREAGKKPTVYVLRRQLRSTEVDKRYAAAVALGQMREGAEKAIPSLQRTLLDGHSRVRVASVVALGQIGEKAVPALLYAMSLRHAKVKTKARQGIEQLGPRKVAALTAALKDPLGSVRLQAATLLGEMKSQAASAAPALSRCLKDEETDVRVAAANALQKMGPGVAEANIVMALGAALRANKSWWRVRVAVANTLKAFGKKSAGVTADLIPLLSDRDKNVHTAATEALIKIGPDTVPAMKQVFTSVPWEAKVRIAYVVRTFGSKAASIIPVIAQGLRDSDTDVRRATIKALLAMKENAHPAIPALRSVILDPQMSRENWLGCLRVFLSIGFQGTEALEQIMNGQNWELRKKIVEGLGTLGKEVGSKGVPVLVNALGSKEKEVRWIAAMVLRKLGGSASSAVSALAKALESPDATTRKLAAKALGAVGAGAKSALPALKKRSGDGDANVRAAVSAAISAIQSASPTPRPAPRSDSPAPPRPVNQ
jgi:HEAT repeat protein